MKQRFYQIEVGAIFTDEGGQEMVKTDAMTAIPVGGANPEPIYLNDMDEVDEAEV